MPKLPQENILTRKISLDQIVETGNVRLNYNQEEIENLADSIFRYGLINPISVKFLREDENGIKKYELIAGHRRVRAYKHLCEKGHDYTQITATICHGEKEIVQLVENIQREQLSQIDIETAVKALVTAGMSQKEIAEELSKPSPSELSLPAGSELVLLSPEDSLPEDSLDPPELSSSPDELSELSLSSADPAEDSSG